MNVVLLLTLSKDNKLPLDVPDLYHQFDDARRIAAIMLLMLRSMPIFLKESPYNGNLLGLYCSDKKCIVLFPDSIYNEAASCNIEVGTLITEVLIHELAHAVMDPTNYMGHTDQYSATYSGYKHDFCGEGSYITYNIARNFYREDNIFPPEIFLEEVECGMDFYHVREESFANLITWRILHQAELCGAFKSKSIKSVENHMSGQPASYSFALDILMAKNSIGGWIESKESNEIKDKLAFEWMEQAESLHNGRNKLDNFITFEYRQLRWAWDRKSIDSLHHRIVRDFFTNNYCVVDIYGAFLVDDIEILNNNGVAQFLLNEIFDEGYHNKMLEEDAEEYIGSYWAIGKDGHFGYLNDKTYIPCNYDQVRKGDSNTFFVRQDNKWGVLDGDGKQVLSIQYGDVCRVDEMYKVKFLGYSQWYLFSKNDHQVTSIGYDDIIVFDALNKRTYKVTKGSKEGLISAAGKEILPIEYDDITMFYGLEKRAYKVFKGGKVELIAVSGNNTLLTGFGDIDKVGEMLKMKPCNGNSWYLCDKKYHQISNEYDEITYFRSWPNSYYKVVIDGNEGLINSSGEVILPVESKEIQTIGIMLKAKSVEDLWYLFDNNCKKLTSRGYDEITVFRSWPNLYYKVVIGGNEGLINSSGRELLPPQYKEIQVLGKMLKAKSVIDNLWHLFRTNGTEVTHCGYDDIRERPQCRFRVIKDGKRNLIDESGNEINNWILI